MDKYKLGLIERSTVNSIMVIDIDFNMTFNKKFEDRLYTKKTIKYFVRTLSSIVTDLF